MLGPTEPTLTTFGPSVGIVRHELFTARVYSVPGGKSGLIVSTVGLSMSVCSFPAAAIRVTPFLRAYWSARVVASMIVRCSSCCVAESAGFPLQL